MRIQLIRPPYDTFNNTIPIRVGLPLGALYVASVLEQKGYDVGVFDSLLYSDGTGNINHFGASWERIKNNIKKFSPEVIGITNQFTQQIGNVLALAKMIKNIDSDIKIVIGGPHASIRPQDFLLSGNFDAVVVGEGEYVFPKVIDYLNDKKTHKKIKGVAYIRGKKIVSVPPEPIVNLDGLPYPAYHMIDMKKYFRANRGGLGTRPTEPFDKPEREISMITSRGCPFNCIFCSIHASMGRLWRAHSADYVIKHLNYVIENYDIELVHFEDDNLTLGIERFNRILEHLKKTGVSWDTPNGIRADTIDRKTLVSIKKTNVKGLRIAIESGNQDVLNRIINKRLDLQKAVDVSRECSELGISLSAFYVIGLPGETKKNIDETLSLAYRLMKNYNVIPHVNIANPLFGTRLYDICKDSNYLVDEDCTKGDIFGFGRIKTKEFSPDELRWYVSAFYRKIMVLYVMNMLKNPYRLAKNLKAFISSPDRTINFIRTSAGFLK